MYYLLPKQQLVDKETRMRMVDITQSYNILDSQMFKSTKLVQEKIEENEQYNLLGAKNWAAVGNIWSGKSAKNKDWQFLLPKRIQILFVWKINDQRF